jgi:hypothetical protein
MIERRIRPWLVRLYPRAWQQRYADEFDALLEQGLRSPLDVVDILLGAFDAHLQLVSGVNVTWRMMNMLNKIRTGLLIVFASFIGFIIAGMSLVGLADDSPMIPLMKTDLALAAAWRIIQAGAVVALLAIVVGGAPLALTILRRAFTSSRRDLSVLLVPGFSFLAVILYLGVIFLVGSERIQIPGVVPTVSPENFPLGNRLLLAGLMLVFVVGAIASTLAVWRAVSRTDVEQETFRPLGRPVAVPIYSFAVIPAAIASVAMLVMLAATLAWFGLTFTALPQVWPGAFGPWKTSTQAWYFGITGLMTLSTAAAFYGLARIRPARKAM